MPDKETRTTDANVRSALEMSARALVEKEKELAVKPKPKPAARPRQVMRVRHMPSEQRRFGASPIYYADQDVPVLEREFRSRPQDYSRAYLLKPVVLYSDSAQRFYERSYEQTDQNLIVVTLVLEIIGSPELVERMNKTLEESFSAIKTLLIDFIGKLQAACPPDADQIASYDHKREYQLPLHTPYSSEFITIVELFDRVNARLDAAWLSGTISGATRRQQVRDWLNAINDFARGIFELRRTALREASQRGRGQDARRIEQQARVEAARSMKNASKTEDKGQDKDEAKPASSTKSEGQNSHEDPKPTETEKKEPEAAATGIKSEEPAAAAKKPASRRTSTRKTVAKAKAA